MRPENPGPRGRCITKKGVMETAWRPTRPPDWGRSYVLPGTVEPSRVQMKLFLPQTRLRGARRYLATYLARPAMPMIGQIVI
jgi:hypothetical protein